MEVVGRSKPSKWPVPKFFHELAEAKELLEALAAEKKLLSVIVEKDYWVMHCLWGLQQKKQLVFEMKGGTSLAKGWDIIDRFSEDIDIKFEAPNGKNLEGDKQAGARTEFYNWIASQIAIPGIEVARDPKEDDLKAQNGRIKLKYKSHFAPIDGLSPHVLLEVGFAPTAPNEPRDFSSWVLDAALARALDVFDNRACQVKCFVPEYTFVDKLQTICRVFRQYRDDGKRKPAEFLRHYYDLYKLLDVARVHDFIGSSGYEKYKTEKLKGDDLAEFKTRSAFMLEDTSLYAQFKIGYEATKFLLLSNVPTFEEIITRIRERAPGF